MLRDQHLFFALHSGVEPVHLCPDKHVETYRTQKQRGQQLIFASMNTLKNRVQLIGNLGADPELQTTSSGKKLVKLSLATHERYTNQQGEQVEETQWHQLAAWGKTAELIERLIKKGDELFVEGKLITRSYEDQEGNKRWSTEILLADFYLMSKKKSSPE